MERKNEKRIGKSNRRRRIRSNDFKKFELGLNFERV